MLENNHFGGGIDKFMNSKGLKKVVLEAENNGFVVELLTKNTILYGSHNTPICIDTLKPNHSSS